MHRLEPLTALGASIRLLATVAGFAIADYVALEVLWSMALKADPGSWTCWRNIRGARFHVGVDVVWLAVFLMGTGLVLVFVARGLRLVSRERLVRFIAVFSTIRFLAAYLRWYNLTLPDLILARVFRTSGLLHNVRPGYVLVFEVVLLVVVLLCFLSSRAGVPATGKDDEP